MGTDEADIERTLAGHREREEYLKAQRTAHDKRIAERATWIRRMCAGKGLPSVDDVYAIPLGLFGVSTYGGLTDTVSFAADLAPSSIDPIRAIRRALGADMEFYGEFPNVDLLLHRREHLADEMGVSFRTITRLEKQGSLIVSEIIERYMYSHTPAQLAVRSFKQLYHSTAANERFDIDRLGVLFEELVQITGISKSYYYGETLHLITPSDFAEGHAPIDLAALSQEADSGNDGAT